MPPGDYENREGAQSDADRLIEAMAEADGRGGVSWLLHYSATGTSKPELHGCDSTLSGMASVLGRVSGGSSIHVMVEKPGLGISHFHARLGHDSGNNFGRYLVFADESQLALTTTTPAGMVSADQGSGSQNSRDASTSIAQPVTLEEMAALEDLTQVLLEEGLEGSESIRRALNQAQPGETPRWELLGVALTTLRHSLHSVSLHNSGHRVLEKATAVGWDVLASELRRSLDRMDT